MELISNRTNKRIPKVEDLYTITNLINDKLWDTTDLSSMEILIKVNKENLVKVNEDLYYRFNNEGEPEDTDEVVINVNGFKITYTTDE